MDSNLPTIWSKIIYDQDGFTLSATHCDKMMYVLFTGVSNALKAMKNKEYPVAFELDMPNKEFVGAAIVQFIPGEDGNPGHWNYVWTFDKEDIPSNARVQSITNTLTWVYFRACAGAKYGMTFEPNTEGIAMSRLLWCINQWLEDNANENEEVGIVLDGIFEARVAVEDKEKVKSLEVIGETKAIIKDDADIEV